MHSSDEISLKKERRFKKNNLSGWNLAEVPRQGTFPATLH